MPGTRSSGAIVALRGGNRFIKPSPTIPWAFVARSEIVLCVIAINVHKVSDELLRTQSDARPRPNHG